MNKKIIYLNILLLVFAFFSFLIFPSFVAAYRCSTEPGCDLSLCSPEIRKERCETINNTCGADAYCTLGITCTCPSESETGCFLETFCGVVNCPSDVMETCYASCVDCGNMEECYPVRQCVPNCNCSPYTCTGEFCNDGCGGMCEGTKDCTEPTPTDPVIPPSSTPPPNLSCNCDSIDVTGNLSPGQTVTFTAKAKVNDYTNNQARVKEMVYFVEQSGIQIANSGNLSASGPETIGNNLYYTSSWNFKIPETGSGTVSYRVYYNWICDQRISSNIPKNNSRLAARIKDLFAKLSGNSNRAINSNAGKVAGLMIAQGSRTIQFESYNPNTSLQKSCQELTFNVVYP